MARALRVHGVLETALYVEDVSRAASFYAETLGLAPIFRDSRLCAMDCGPRSVLLLFARGTTSQTEKLPGGEIPSHEGEGRLHFALAVAKEDLPSWEQRLADKSVAIEGRVKWPRGGESLYFRDPDANLVEIATPGLWPNY
jgi:catechol-2,3-dioxygenase